MKHPNVRLIWGIIMTAFYLGMAVMLVISDLFNLNKVLQIILAVLFFAYGIFRGYRVWKPNGNNE